MAIACTNHPAVTTGIARCSRCQKLFCANCIVVLQGKRLCGGCKTEHVADVKSGTSVTGVELATLGRRFLAMWLDGMILLIPTFGIMFALGGGSLFAQQGSFAHQTLIGLLAGLPAVVYEALMLSSGGQTVGKKALKIRVVTPEGQPIDSRQAWMRAITRWCLTSFLAFFNIIAVFFGNEKAAIHDRVAGTRVVRWDA